MLILLLLALFVALLLIRALLFVPPKASHAPTAAPAFDRQRSVEAMAALIKCKTVSNADPTLDAVYRRS